MKSIIKQILCLILLTSIVACEQKEESKVSKSAPNQNVDSVLTLTGAGQ